MIKKIISLVILSMLVFFLLIIFIPRVKAANTTLMTSPESVNGGPPWYDNAWLYRRPVIIHNTGEALPWYQVQVTLDAGNFDFSLASVDGADIRFTHSDGTTSLNYWIESWDNPNQIAHLWVKVPGIATGYTSIYLYFDNPNATPVSTGTSTFDYFDDDWSQFTGFGQNRNVQVEMYRPDGKLFSPFNWLIINGTPEANSGILGLMDGEGVKSTSTTQNNAMGMRAYFGSGNGYEWAGFINAASGQRTMIGDLPADPDDLYLQNFRTASENTIIPRVGGNDWHNTYHIYEIRWQANQSMIDVDHGASTVTSTPAQVPDGALPVTLYSYSGSNAELQVDWVYNRQYRNPQPTYTLGPEQGLVDLEISAMDSPDPLPSDATLTYQLGITNTSTIAAHEVIVTDTLPASLQVTSWELSQGTCSGSNEIVCHLGTLEAGGAAQIIIEGIPHQDGVITNSARVDTVSYDSYSGNNESEVQTLVDSVLPTVSWEEPVGNREVFISYGGEINLLVTAADNDQVERVEYWQYDGNSWGLIGTVNLAPYLMTLNTDTLVPDQVTPIEAYSYDRAGNRSSTNDALRQIIYIDLRTLHLVYFPCAVK